MKKCIVLVLFLLVIVGGFFVYNVFDFVYYPIHINRESYMEREENVYNKNIESVKEDGFINPIVYSVTQNRLDKYIDNHSTNIFEDIKTGNGLGESICLFKEENNIVNQLYLSSSPYLSIRDKQINLGKFYINKEFFRYFDKNNMEKILKKNGITDSIDDMYIINPVYETDNIDSMIACIICNNKFYFVTWERCKNDIERLKQKAIKSFFQGSYYNYFTFYNDDEFKAEFKSQKASILVNGKEINTMNALRCHNSFKFPLFTVIDNLGIKYEKLDELNYYIYKGEIKYRFGFSKNTSWGNIYTLNIYDDKGNLINENANCTFTNNEFIINNEDYAKIERLIGSKNYYDYENSIVEINN